MAGCSWSQRRGTQELQLLHPALEKGSTFMHLNPLTEVGRVKFRGNFHLVQRSSGEQWSVRGVPTTSAAIHPTEGFCCASCAATSGRFSTGRCVTIGGGTSYRNKHMARMLMPTMHIGMEWKNRNSVLKISIVQSGDHCGARVIRDLISVSYWLRRDIKGGKVTFQRDGDDQPF
eukprot:gi/632967269/ref/XP_007899885.1/ PREDICTED: uncharacterized protein LOC103183930 isoform X2 [Callorhinchus milii]